MEKCLLIRVEIEAKFCNNTNTHLFNAINYKKMKNQLVSINAFIALKCM